jgi:hypothetical protein
VFLGVRAVLWKAKLFHLGQCEFFHEKRLFGDVGWGEIGDDVTMG